MNLAMCDYSKKPTAEDIQDTMNMIDNCYISIVDCSRWMYNNEQYMPEIWQPEICLHADKKWLTEVDNCVPLTEFMDTVKNIFNAGYSCSIFDIQIKIAIRIQQHFNYGSFKAYDRPFCFLQFVTSSDAHKLYTSLLYIPPNWEYLEK